MVVGTTGRWLVPLHQSVSHVLHSLSFGNMDNSQIKDFYPDRSMNIRTFYNPMVLDASIFQPASIDTIP